MRTSVDVFTCDRCGFQVEAHSPRGHRPSLGTAPLSPPSGWTTVPTTTDVGHLCPACTDEKSRYDELFMLNVPFSVERRTLS